MALLEIELLGAKALRREAAPVEEVDRRVRRLVRDMFDTMYHADGLGLAAPQVGVSQRILVLDVTNSDDRRHVHALINPVITAASDECADFREGCLSIPGVEEVVRRPLRVVVEASTPEGEPVTIEADGLLARTLQHEVDHLDGILFIDRLSPLKRSFALKKWRKNQRAADPRGSRGSPGSRGSRSSRSSRGSRSSRRRSSRKR